MLLIDFGVTGGIDHGVACFAVVDFNLLNCKL
jgi:hypothetical protein